MIQWLKRKLNYNNTCIHTEELSWAQRAPHDVNEIAKMKD